MKLHLEMYFSIVNTLTETGKLEEIYVHMLVIQLLCAVLKYSLAKNGPVCVNFFNTRSATYIVSAGMCKSKIQEWFLIVVSV